jgi:uncharacterized protein YeaO (DUF488 family)
MRIMVKRVYDAYAKTDGVRVLGDRLWPRGITKTMAHIDVWAKDLAPSTLLRKWYHEDPEKRFEEFCKRYQKELKSKKEEGKELVGRAKRLTLVTSVKDIPHSHIPELVRFLGKF